LLARGFAGLGGGQALYHLYRLSDAVKSRTKLPYRFDNVEGSSSGLLPFDTIPVELEHGRFHFWLYYK